MAARMWTFGGLTTALVFSVLTWVCAGAAATNLPSGTRALVQYVLVCVAAIIGFLAGAAVFRRATKSRDHLALFSGIALAFAGGLIGCAYAIGVTASYLASYSSWPAGRIDQVLVILAYPIFGGLGALLGAIAGCIFGMLVGGILRLAGPARQ